MLLVYVEEITPRLQYIFRFIGRELFETNFQLTTDLNFYKAQFVPKLNYSKSEIEEGEFYLRPVNLLFEHDLKEQHVECFELNFHKAIFPVPGDFPMDIFAASFFLMSRYEEWHFKKSNPNAHFSAEMSLAFREQFLREPLINIWINEFKTALGQTFPDLTFHRKSFRQILTYDIRSAYKVRYSTTNVKYRRLLNHLLKGNLHELGRDWNIMKGKVDDPYDFFERLDALHLYCRVKPYFFFNVSQQYINENKILQQEIARLVEYYASNYRIGLLWNNKSSDDKDWVEVVTEQELTSSRHPGYEKSSMNYYQKLVRANVHDDFSMGYSTTNGFRASVCSTFYWYDFENEIETDLKVFPVCFRDLSAINSGLDAAHSYQELMGYYNLVKKLNGILVTSWSNEVLKSDPDFNDWNKMFELFMKEQVYWDAYRDQD
ncbi:MAG TPA: hypothetical protein VLC28_11980 [Flavitalea sp.]|nr:hypothetical protein [Flavitalea sp.]